MQEMTNEPKIISYHILFVDAAVAKASDFLGRF